MFQSDKELKNSSSKSNRDEIVRNAAAKRAGREVKRKQQKAVCQVITFWRRKSGQQKVLSELRAQYQKQMTDIQTLASILKIEFFIPPMETVLKLLHSFVFFYSPHLDAETLLPQQCLLVLKCMQQQTMPLGTTTLSDGQIIHRIKKLVQYALLYHLRSSKRHTKDVSVYLELVLHLVQNHHHPELRNSIELMLMKERMGCNRKIEHILNNKRLKEEELFTFLELVRFSFLNCQGHKKKIMNFLEKYSPSHMLGYDGEIQLLVVLFKEAFSNRSSYFNYISSFIVKILSVPVVGSFFTVEDTLNGIFSNSNEINTPTWKDFVLLISQTMFEIDREFLYKQTEWGITNVSWLFGNLLAIIDKQHQANGSVDAHARIAELELFQLILPKLPTEIYSGLSGIGSGGWCNVSKHHSKPIVYPHCLKQQLALLVDSSSITEVCHIFLDNFDWPNMALKRPLLNKNIVPMNPDAATYQEQFGFGSISVVMSKSIWYNRLFSSSSSSCSKPQSKSLSFTSISSFFGFKKDTSAEEKKTSTKTDKTRVKNNLGEETKCPHKARISTINDSLKKKCFDVSGIHCLSQFYVLYLFLYPTSSKHSIRTFSMGVLSALSFYRTKDSVVSPGRSSSQISIVEILWTLIQEVVDVSKIAKSMDVLKCSKDDPFSCVFALFCMTYHHLLLVSDEEEMYQKQYPLPLYEVERIIVLLKQLLYRVYWLSKEDLSTNSFGNFVVDKATELLRCLYSRCSKRPFCNVTSWIVAELSGDRFVTEVNVGSPRAMKMLNSIPFLISYTDRVNLFQKLIATEKIKHQHDTSPVYRIVIRRGFVLEDGMKKINSIGKALRKKIQVVFVNSGGREEVGIDGGGLFKEFWCELADLSFNPNYGLFKVTPNGLESEGSGLLYPNPGSSLAHPEAGHLALFEFLGRILGKALFEGIVVEPKFASFFLSKLLANYNQVQDLPSLDAQLYKNLMFLKNYEGDVAADLGLTFTIGTNVFGQQKEVELIPGGSAVEVTNTNRIRYIHHVANYYLNEQIKDQSRAFLRGLSDLINATWLHMFNEPELHVLISGNSSPLDIQDLKKYTRYSGGYYAQDKYILRFWKIMESLTANELSSFLRFTTSCQRAPSLGFKALQPPFCIQKISISKGDEKLPSSSTCFNTLKLPTYHSASIMKQKILYAINSNAGFEMS